MRVSSAKPSNIREISEKKMTLKYWFPAQAWADQVMMQQDPRLRRQQPAHLGKAPVWHSVYCLEAMGKDANLLQLSQGEGLCAERAWL